MWNALRLIFISTAVMIQPALTEIAAGAERSSEHEATHGRLTSSDEFASALRAAMSKMHEDMARAPMTGDADRDFLAMMIPHHVGAVEMAHLVLLHGRDPLIRQLAEEIIATQQVEIAAMAARAQILSRGPDTKPGGFPAIGGTRGESDRQ